MRYHVGGEGEQRASHSPSCRVFLPCTGALVG